jgi:DNA-binding transcriptional LysR family regulator
VELGSFSAVAREFGESHSAVTRQIGHLEERFGTRLFHRNTRRLTLTEDGGELLGYARQMLELAETIDGGPQRGLPKGLVRVGMTVGGGMFLVPRIPRLLERYPGLSVELVMNDHAGDLIEERLDLAVRPGPITDSALIARALLPGRRIVVAAPTYLERRGVPRTPADLVEHDCILWSERDSRGWRFAGPEGPFEMRISSRFAANHSTAVHFATLSGQGIAILPEVRVIDDIRADRLRPLLTDYQAPGQKVFVVYASRRHLAPRTRAVIDFLFEQTREFRHQSGEANGTPVFAECGLP